MNINDKCSERKMGFSLVTQTATVVYCNNVPKVMSFYSIDKWFQPLMINATFFKYLFHCQIFLSSWMVQFCHMKKHTNWYGQNYCCNFTVCSSLNFLFKIEQLLRVRNWSFFVSFDQVFWSVVHKAGVAVKLSSLLNTVT